MAKRVKQLNKRIVQVGKHYGYSPLVKTKTGARVGHLPMGLSDLKHLKTRGSDRRKKLAARIKKARAIIKAPEGTERNGKRLFGAYTGG